jgi:hypothetical protein
VQLPSLQSEAELQRCVSAHGAQLPPQSTSDSPLSTSESWQCGRETPASELEKEKPGVPHEAESHAHTKPTAKPLETRASFNSNIAAKATSLRACALPVYCSAACTQCFLLISLRVRAQNQTVKDDL